VPGTTGEDRLRLAGGLVLKSDFGDFVAPNISPHPTDGIGAWSAADFANAMLRGVSPQGSHYYPAFPYPSFARMTPADVADLWAYLQTLPAAEGRPPLHAIGFPFGFRRGIGLWKLAYLDPAPVVEIDPADPVLARGRHLVEAVGHCGECHTPRNFAGGPDRSRWLAGGPAPEGDGRIPNITPGGDLGRWSPGEIANFLETGITPEFDVVGVAMAEVQRNMSSLPPADRTAIAAYLKVVPPVPAKP
jgi:mono/diheme cytochrome c family protein